MPVFGIALALTLLVGCGITDTSVSRTDQSAQGVDPSFGYVVADVSDLLTCKPQPYIATTKLVGARGGRIKVGSHVLDIPEGALARDVFITAEQVTDSVNSVRFGPEGLTFDRPAELSMSYDNCTVVRSPKSIVYTSEALEILEVLPSKDRSQNRIVTSPVDHFSRYAVAY